MKFSVLQIDFLIEVFKKKPNTGRVFDGFFDEIPKKVNETWNFFFFYTYDPHTPTQGTHTHWKKVKKK